MPKISHKPPPLPCPQPTDNINKKKFDINNGTNSMADFFPILILLKWASKNGDISAIRFITMNNKNKLAPYPSPFILFLYEHNG